MKFYPLRNWQRGQPTVLIDGNTYYTLESATEWEITEAEETTVTIAAHKGEEWIKKRDLLKRKPAMEPGPNRSGEDRQWIKEMLEKSSVRIVTSQEADEVVIVASTSPDHQDAGTIKLDKEAREEAEKEKGKAAAEPVPNQAARSKGKGKGKAGKTSRTTPPVTRARKRARQTNTEGSRTASQDSCTPRNPLEGERATSNIATADTGETTGNAREKHGHEEGYTPPSTQEAAQIAETGRARTQIEFIQQLLATQDPRAKGIIRQILQLIQEKALRTGPQLLERLEPEMMKEAHAASDREDTNRGELELLMLRKAINETEDPLLGKAAKKFVWSLIELANQGALTCDIKDLERADKALVDKARMVSWIDEREEQNLEANATKKDILKLRDEMFTQHQATFKQAAKIEEFKEHFKETREKEKSILVQIHQALETLAVEKTDNNRILLQLVTKMDGAEKKLDAHWEEL